MSKVELDIEIKVKPESNPFTRVNYMMYNPFNSQGGIKLKIKEQLREGVFKDSIGPMLYKLGLNEDIVNIILVRLNIGRKYRVHVEWDGSQGILTVRKVKGEIEEERKNG